MDYPLERLTWILKERICLLKYNKHDVTVDGWCMRCLKWLPDEPITALAFFVGNEKLRPWADDQNRHPVSNSQLRRWLDQRSVLMNGKRPTSTDFIEYPITQLVWFPGGKKQCSLL